MFKVVSDVKTQKAPNLGASRREREREKEREVLMFLMAPDQTGEKNVTKNG